MAELKNAQLKFFTTDIYGDVYDGWVQLFGHLKPVMVVQRPTSADDPERWLQYASWPAVLRGADSKILPFIDYAVGNVDVEFVLFDGKLLIPAFCVPVLKENDNDPEAELSPELYCFLLVPCISITELGGALLSPRTMNPDEFQRVGLAKFRVRNWSEFKAWPDESPKRDIIIR